MQTHLNYRWREISRVGLKKKTNSTRSRDGDNKGDIY